MPKIRILFLGSNPITKNRLGLEEEYRAIDHKLRLCDATHYIDLVSDWAVRLDELHTSLLRHSPHIVHFAGHGNPDGEILLAGDDGEPQSVTPDALKKLFTALKDNIRVAVFNACFSKPQAQAVTKVIDCAVGMNAKIQDDTAVTFASTFYEAIGFGRSVKQAFDVALAAIAVKGLRGEHVPELIIKRRVDPARVFLVAHPPSVNQPEFGAAQFKTLPAGTDRPSDLRPEASDAPQVSTAASSGRSVGEEESKVAGDASAPLTDPTGKVFISYRRSHVAEVATLMAALHDRGVPTWQDIHDLEEKPMGSALRGTLTDPEISGGVLWITPDLPDSPVIQRIEAPAMLERARRNDGFFVIPFLAGGVDYDAAKDLIDPIHAYEDLSRWNLRNVKGSPIDHAEAAELANRVLRHRVGEIHKRLPKEQPLRLELNTRKRLPWKSGTALLLDWKDRFDDRLAKAGAWEQFLLPALEDVAQAIEQCAPDRTVEASGRLALPAAVAFGACFRGGWRPATSWRQYTPRRGNQLWNIDEPREESGFKAEIRDHDPAGDELAALVMVNDDVDPAFQQALRGLPALRGIVRVTRPGDLPHDLATPGEALDVAHVTVDAINQARSVFRMTKCVVHLFMAVPAGLAMMIGQLLNKVPLAQTYELDDQGGVSRYVPAGRLLPSGCDG
jgi:hypothetical protein